MSGSHPEARQSWSPIEIGSLQKSVAPSYDSKSTIGGRIIGGRIVVGRVAAKGWITPPASIGGEHPARNPAMANLQRD
jgi:hypothetical protein